MMGWDRMLRKDNNKMGNRETDGEKEEKHIERDRDKYTENERGRERVGIKDENTAQSTLQNTAQRNPPYRTQHSAIHPTEHSTAQSTLQNTAQRNPPYRTQHSSIHPTEHSTAQSTHTVLYLGLSNKHAHRHSV
jgi:hypothetical protein